MKIYISKSPVARKCITIIRRSISPTKVAFASMELGKELGYDIIDNLGLDPKKEYTALLGSRDSYFETAGLKQVFPRLKLIYLNSREAHFQGEKTPLTETD
ncbi:MAG: hypothetical protein QXJ75_00460 [Candidatus Bathyarchaeia archaeon]